MPHGRTVLIINKLKGNLMRKLVILYLSSAALFIPLVSPAMTIHGDIHPERYTDLDPPSPDSFCILS